MDGSGLSYPLRERPTDLMVGLDYVCCFYVDFGEPVSWRTSIYVLGYSEDMNQHTVGSLVQLIYERLTPSLGGTVTSFMWSG